MADSITEPTACLIFLLGNVTDTTGNSAGKSVYITMITSYFYTALVIFSLLIFGIKRKNLWPGCCFQRPGAPSPGNLITSRKNRLAYTLIFGLTVETVFLIIFEPDSVPLAIPLSYINWDSFGMGWITRKILAINFYAIYYWPLFLSVRQNNFIGLLLGFFQTAVLFAYKIIALVICGSDGKTNMTSQSFRALTTLICGFVLMLVLLRKMIKLVKISKTDNNRSILFTADDSEDNFLFETHHEKHVEYLLSSDQNKKILSRNYPKWDCLKKFKNHPGFLYSTRILSSSFLALLIIYQLMIFMSDEIKSMIATSNELANSEEASGGLIQVVILLYVVFTGNDPTQALQENASIFSKAAAALVDGAWISLIVCLIISLLISISGLILQIPIYKRHYRKLLQGNKTHLQTQKLTAPGAVTATLKYGAYSIAYQVWAFAFFVAILWLICLVFILIVYIPALFGNDWCKDLVIDMVPGWIYTVVIIVLQSILSTYVFLYDKEIYKLRKKNDEFDPQASLHLTNYRVYDLCVYLFWFNNLFVGIWSLLMRLIYAACVSLAFLGRLDQPAVQRNWETLDAGYNCYLGQLAVDVANTHPVMLSFVKMMLKKSEKAPSKAQKRWWVAYTLVKNPKLVYERKQKLPIIEKNQENETENAGLCSCFKKKEISPDQISQIEKYSM